MYVFHQLKNLHGCTRCLTNMQVYMYLQPRLEYVQYNVQYNV